MRDGDRLRFVQTQEIGDDALEGGHRLGVSRSPMCWLMKTCRPTLSATVFFRCAPTARMVGTVVLQRDRQRRIAAGAAQQARDAAHDPRHAVVDMAGDGPVVHQEDVGDVAEPLYGLDLVRADRLVAQVAAGSDDREARLSQQEMVKWRVGQHDAEIRVVGGDFVADDGRPTTDDRRRISTR